MTRRGDANAPLSVSLCACARARAIPSVGPVARLDSQMYPVGGSRMLSATSGRTGVIKGCVPLVRGITRVTQIMTTTQRRGRVPGLWHVACRVVHKQLC